MNWPNDPFMLMSVINTRLRDGIVQWQNCPDADAIAQKLAAIGYHYNPKTNQFQRQA